MLLGSDVLKDLLASIAAQAGEKNLSKSPSVDAHNAFCRRRPKRRPLNRERAPVRPAPFRCENQ